MDTRTGSLKQALAEIPDFRHAQGRRYELLSLLLLACVAMLCGARSQKAIAEWGRNYGTHWLRRIGINRRTAPSQATIHRVFKALDAVALEHAITRWAQSVLGTRQPLEGVAADGKTLCGARKQGAAEPHLVSLVSQRLGLVLAQVAGSVQTGEQAQLEQLLEQLTLTGLVVTADALHTQPTTAQQILDGGGDYLLVVKDNQPTLAQEIALVFATSTLADTVQVASNTDCHGGRIETRCLAASPALAGWSQWPGLAQVLKLERTVTDKRRGSTRQEVVYGVTSLRPAQATPRQLLALWRGHWTIENKLHWVRDVTFDEDRSTVRSGKAPQVMAALRNVAISLLRLRKETNIAAALRKYAAHPVLAFTALGI